MFHNKEMQKLFSVFLLLSIISLTLGFYIHFLAGILVIFTAAYGITFYIFTRKRYKSIAHISEQIDLVLHNAEHLYISDNNEGELSILQCEITKMTRRIHEQNQCLKNEKKFLADSLADIVTFQKESINMNELVNAALHPFQISMDLHNITVKQNISKTITIHGDMAWLSEAFQNIMKNCMESSG